MRAVVLLAAASLFAQTPANRPSYEAAMVKLNTSGENGQDDDSTTGQTNMRNLPLQRLIAMAYEVKPAQVSGPKWLEDVRIDIVAKFPAGAKESEHPAMLRTLLEDRFHMAVHRETKDMPGYAMVLAKGGFKLKPVEAEGNDTDHHGGRVQTLAAKGTSMASLADLVSRYLNTVVVDRTEVAGAYNFELKWSRDDLPAVDQPPTLPVVLEDVLGVRLQAQKVPVEMVVVDRIDRAPTDN